MSYSVSPGNIFGRIGTGIGKGLAETAPKEIERGRLTRGLQEFEKESGNLTPMQSLARLASIPGALDRPELVRQFGELARQQARSNALSNTINEENQQRKSPFIPKEQISQPSSSNEIPSITTSRPVEETLENYIPKTYEQLIDRAGELFNKNPALYNNDANQAIEAANIEEQQRKSINEAYQTRKTNEEKIQDNIVNRLRKHSENLNIKIPENIYSEIENKAILATKPIKNGGKGLTEQQAMKEYGKELDAISRDYQSINNIGSWGASLRKPSETLRTLSNLQQKFEKRNDTENFADTLGSTLQLSPMIQYAIAEPVSREKNINNEISKLPELSKLVGYRKGLSEIPQSEVDDKTLKISKNLSDKMTKKTSPLAIAYELKKKGYNPEIFLDYLLKNRKKLNLSEQQGRQLDKPLNLTGTWNDWWLSSFSGLE
jgi:hypothetical protein